MFSFVRKMSQGHGNNTPKTQLLFANVLPWPAVILAWIVQNVWFIVFNNISMSLYLYSQYGSSKHLLKHFSNRNPYFPSCVIISWFSISSTLCLSSLFCFGAVRGQHFACKNKLLVQLQAQQLNCWLWPGFVNFSTVTKPLMGNSKCVF